MALLRKLGRKSPFSNSDHHHQPAAATTGAATALPTGTTATAPLVIPDPASLHFSDTIRPETFKQQQVAWDGFACPPHVVAYDPVQSLLAMGNAHGLLRVYGQMDAEAVVPGTGSIVRFDVERPLLLPGHCCVQFMTFDTNQGRLVCIDDRSKIIVFDLISGRLHTTASAAETMQDKASITCIQLVQGSSWLLFGADDGVVRLFNVNRSLLSPYTIPCGLANTSDLPAKMLRVVAAVVNPDDPNQALIGHRVGDVFLWDMKIRKHTRKFVAPRAQGLPDVMLLAAVSWNPSGSHFVTAYANGLIAFWDPSSTTPLAMRMLDNGSLSGSQTSQDESHRDQITKLRWTVNSATGESALYFSGGSAAESMRGVTIMTVGPAPFPIKSSNMLAIDGVVADFEVLSLNPWMNEGQDPIALVVLPEVGAFQCLDIGPNGALVPVRVPSSMRLNVSPITAIKYATLVEPELIELLGSWQSVLLYAQKSWPLRGGQPPQLSDCDAFHIVITAHDDGHVRFWDASRSVIRLLCDLDAKKFCDPPSPRSPTGTTSPSSPSSPRSAPKIMPETSTVDALTITQLDFDPTARVLVLGWADGQVMHFSLLNRSSSRQRPNSFTQTNGLEHPPSAPDTGPTTAGQHSDNIHAYEPGPDARGFVLTLHSCDHRASISAMAFCATWSLLATGDLRGVVTVIHLEQASIAFQKTFSAPVSSALSRAERLPVMTLAFSHSYSSDTDDQLYPMLIIGLQNATVHFYKIVRHVDGNLELVKVSSIQPREPGLPLMTAFITDLGDYVQPKTIHWPPPTDSSDIHESESMSSMATTGTLKKASSIALTPNHAPHFVIMAMESQIRVHTNVGADSRFAKASLDDSFYVSAFVLDKLPEGGLCLACVTGDAQLYFYTLPELAPIKSMELMANGNEDLLTISALKQIYITREGRLLLITEFARCSGIQRCLLVEQSDQIAKSQEFGIMFVPDVVFPIKPIQTGMMKRFLGGLISNPEPTQTFALWDVPVPVASPSVPPKYQTASNSARKTYVTEAEREELLAGATKAPPVPNKDVDTSTSSSAASRKKASEGSESAGSSAQRAMQGLQERGEKLNRTSERTAEMANEAQNFYEMARKLREKNERQSKSWFPF